MKKSLAFTVVTAIFIFCFTAQNSAQAWPAFSNSSSITSAQSLYDQAVAAKKRGELLQSKSFYEQLIQEHPRLKNIDVIQKELQDLNVRIICSNASTPESVIYEVQSGDSLGKIAKRYHTTTDLIKLRNHLENNVIRVGQKLSVWNGNFNILVDKSDNTLTLKDKDDIVKIYSVSTGRNNITPVGEFTITSRIMNPTWFNKGEIVPPGTPDNHLGTRWLGFDKPGYGIHGTVEPQFIGQQVSHGCVRMRNADVEQLFVLIPEGTKVTIVD